jgi:choline kinase
MGTKGSKGIILAAGKGARLNGGESNVPKCLLTIGGRTLLERQIAALRNHGIDDITVVIGCEADRVRRSCGSGVAFLENARFAQTNSLYSLWLARPLLLDGFVVLNCDVLFHPQLLADLLTAQHEDCLLVSYFDRDAIFGDEEMKVRVRRGAVVEISKAIDPAQSDAENVGIARFGRDGAQLLVREMDRLVSAGALKEWAPRAFQEFAAKRPLHAIGTRGLPWIEIDFPEDYRRAMTEILPQIEDEPQTERRRTERRRVRNITGSEPPAHAAVH